MANKTIRQVTSLTRSGLGDFVLQRLSAYVILLYSLCLFSLFVQNPDYQAFYGFFANPMMRWFGIFSVLAIALHAWIGIWTIGGDYITERTFGGLAVWLRSMYQGGCALLILVYLAWGWDLLGGLRIDG